MKKNYIFAILTVFIWATMAVVVKLLLTDIPDLESLCISSVFAFIFMLIVNIVSGKIRLLKKYSFLDFVKMAGLGFLGLFMYSALYYFGISRLTSQTACILNYLWPVVVLIFSCLILKENFTVKKLMAMLLSFGGIVLLTLGNAFGKTEGSAAGNLDWMGIAVCIVAAVCYGLFNVLNKKCNYDQNICMMIIWIVTAIFSGVAGIFLETWKPVHGLQWAGILWLGVVIDAVAYYLWAMALNTAENSSVITNLAYLTPFISVVISAVVLKEKMNFTAVIALILIILGNVIQNIQWKSKAQKEMERYAKSACLADCKSCENHCGSYSGEEEKLTKE